MSHEQIKSGSMVWLHFSELKDADFDFLRKEFKFHPLDFDDIRDDSELSKLDVYKYYLFSIINIPVFDAVSNRLIKRNLAIFIGKDYVITTSRKPIETVERFFARVKRSPGLKRDALSKSTGYFLYKLLDYIFKDSNVILRELVKETERVENHVYDSNTKVTTKRLGVLRRNILFLRHIIDPERLLVEQFKHNKKAFIGSELNIYFDDVKDSLDNTSVISDNLKNIVDGLFEVNESLLSHRMNEIIRLLTVISVVLMPPTLITGYYGMNVEKLPFSGDVLIVTVIITFSIIVFWFLTIGIDRRQK